MAIAFFDLDKTLLAINSGTLWVRSEYRQGHLSLRRALWGLSWLARYHVGAADLEDTVLAAIATVAGDDEHVMRERALRFYRTELRHRFRPGGLEALERHRAAGDRLVLLSSTTWYLAEPVQQDLRLDHSLCNRLEVRDGRFTGKPDGPLCFGAGKLTHARAYAEQSGVRLEDCTFYTDSMSDAPALEGFGRPVVVHPDPRLRRKAQRVGWPIVDWGDRGRSPTSA